MSHRLYVVAGSHYINDSDTNEQNKIKDVLEVRLGVMEALARTVKRGGLFLDGVGPREADLFNKRYFTCPPQEEDLQTIQTAIGQAYRREEYTMYDTGRTIGLFFRLRWEGIEFQLKPTEYYDFMGNAEGVLQRYALRIVREQREREAFERARNIEELASHLLEPIFNLRDEDVVNNIITHAEEENILFIGTDHKLATLQSSGLEWYRIDIDGENTPLLVTGTVPGRFQERMESIPRTTTSGRAVELKIQYQK